MTQTLLLAAAGWLALNYAVACLLMHRALRQERLPRLAALRGALAWPVGLFSPSAVPL